MELKEKFFPDEIKKRQKSLFFESSKDILNAIEEEIWECDFPIEFTNSLMKHNYDLIVDGKSFIQLIEEFVRNYNKKEGSVHEYVIESKNISLGYTGESWKVILDLKKKN